jgi:peptidylprolyl isomerase
MATAKMGDRVRIDYTGKLQDGSVFDSTHGDGDCINDDCGCESGPRELTIGQGEFLSAIEDALVGMAAGDSNTVIVPADEAFGEYDVDKVFTVARSDLPSDLNPDVGDEIVLVNDDDEELGVVVVEVDEKEITFDANHPLAGEDLSFEFKLLDIL